MSTSMLGWLRKRALVTAPEEITFPVRGFDIHDAPARPVLEAAALHFTVGFEFGIECRTLDGVYTRLETLQREYRGFAYEGAIMASAVRDVMSPLPGPGRTERFLAGLAAPHAFLGCLGIGFALGRLPRALWHRAMPALAQIPDYPTVVWSIIDGFGFHQAFFRTRRWVDSHYLPRGLVWAGRRDYVQRAIDQGTGRALWFVAGGNVGRLGRLVETFDPARHSDLWSGVGLAATYAGGVAPDDLAALARLADKHRPELALGAVLAIRARTGADLVTAHTDAAAQTLCECSVERATELADDAMRRLPGDSVTPAYEVFRQRIRAHFA